MNFTVNKEKIISFVQDLCRKRNVSFSCTRAETTESLYFRIWKDGSDSHVSFRISDHMKKRFIPNFKILLIKNNTTFAHIERFVENRIASLKTVSVLHAIENLNEGGINHA